MRTPLRTLLAFAALTACAPGTVYVVREPISNPRPAPRPAPAPAPAPAPVAPLEVDIGRPHRGQLIVQTNRPAYVALFEIIPDQGVTLVHPSSARERRFMVSGPRRLPVWFDEARVTPAASRGPAREPVRYIYVLASDEPLRITDQAFHASYLRTVLGPITYRGANPYATMRAIASRFAPDVRDEKWAEDVMLLDSRRRAEPQHVARVYCPGGVVLEVPEELADRAWCPGRRGNQPGSAQPAGDDPPPSRPDSVKGNNGRRVQMRAHGTPGEQPRSRVREEMTMPASGQPAALPAQPNPGTPGQAAEKPGERRGQDEDRPGERRGQGEDRPGNRRGQTDDKPGNGPPPGAGTPGTPASPSTPGTTGAQPPGQEARPDNAADAGRPGTAGPPANAGRPETVGPPPTAGRPESAGAPASTGRPANAGPPANAGRPEPAGRNSPAPPDTAKPGNRPQDRTQPVPQQQQPSQEPPKQQPQAQQPPQASSPPTASPPPAASGQPAKPEPQKPAPANPGQGRGQPKPKTAPDSTSTPPAQQAAPDTTAKPGKGRPPSAGRPPVPLS